MTWPNFLAPWWGLLGLLAVPIVLLYLLRQKRPSVGISSTLLWTKALADMRASTPFQKLRRHLLLLLQLLILAALTLTLMRPVIQAHAAPSSVGVIIIDATASMQATDHGGPSRLERAKEEARKLIDAMRPGDQFAVLVGGAELAPGPGTDASTPERSSGFLSSKSDLYAAIDAITPSDLATDLSEKLLVAADSLRHLVATSGPQTATALTAGKIWLFSDGVSVTLPNVPEMENLLKFVKIGDSADNVGIVRLAISPVPKEPKTYQVFAGLFNASPRSRTVFVGLAYEKADKFIATTHVTLGPNAVGGALFEKVVVDPGRIFIQLDGKDDDLALDNTAYALIAPPRKVRLLLVTTGNQLLENFVKTAVKLGEVEGEILDPAHFNPKAEPFPADLVILDGPAAVPAVMPPCDTLIIRPGATVAGFKVLGTLDHPAILRYLRDDPVLSFISLDELHIFSALKVAHDPETRELVTSTQGPLLASRDEGSSRRYLLAFDPLKESDWYVQPSFLIFVEHLIEETRARHFIGTPQILGTGSVAKLFDLAPPPDKTTLTLPNGATMPLTPQDGAAEFAATDHVGFYQVTSGDKQAAFAVNLLSAAASNIAPRSLQLTSGSNVQEEAGIATVNKEIWTWFSLAALAVLMIEWFFYHRRIA